MNDKEEKCGHRSMEDTGEVHGTSTDLESRPPLNTHQPHSDTLESKSHDEQGVRDHHRSTMGEAADLHDTRMVCDENKRLELMMEDEMIKNAVIYNDCDNDGNAEGIVSIDSMYFPPRDLENQHHHDMEVFVKEYIAEVVEKAWSVYRSEGQTDQAVDEASGYTCEKNNNCASLESLKCGENATLSLLEKSVPEILAPFCVSSGGDSSHPPNIISGVEFPGLQSDTQATVATETSDMIVIEDMALMLVEDAFSEAYGIIQGDILPWDAILQESSSDEENMKDDEDDLALSCNSQGHSEAIHFSKCRSPAYSESHKNECLENFVQMVVESAIQSGVQEYRKSSQACPAGHDLQDPIARDIVEMEGLAPYGVNRDLYCEVDQSDAVGSSQDGLISDPCSKETSLALDNDNDPSSAQNSGKVLQVAGKGLKTIKKQCGRFRRKCVSTKVPTKGYKHKSLAETYEDLACEDTLFHDSFSCPVCWDVLYSAHSCRPCHHVFCEPCLRRLAKYCKDAGRSALCPICRETIAFCVKDTPLSQSVQELFPDDYYRRRRTEGRGHYMSHPMPSKDAAVLPPEQIAQLLAHARTQRQRRPRLQLNPGRLSVMTFVSFALVFILLKGMVGVAVMALYNMSLGYVIGDTLVTASSLLEDLRATNIVFSWICSAIAFSLTAFVFFACKKFYQRWRNR